MIVFHSKLTRLFALTLQIRNIETGNVDVGYLISPVKDSSGNFFNSDDYKGETTNLPLDADANGAFNIARKALIVTERIRNADEDELRRFRLTVKKRLSRFRQKTKE